jgi:hypothetical protein
MPETAIIKDDAWPGFKHEGGQANIIKISNKLPLLPEGGARRIKTRAKFFISIPSS